MNLADWGGQERPLSEHVKVIEAVCAALEAQHRKGQAQGGIDPSRLEIRPDGTCRIRDGSVDRSSPYVAPELRGPGGQKASPKSDVYSVGVAFYEMLSGERPDSPPRPLVQVRPDLPRDLADGITACVEADPEWRPGDLTYVAECARRLSGQPAPTPARKGSRTAAAEPSREGLSFSGLANTPATSRSAWIVVAGAVVLFAGAAAWWWFGRNPSEPPATLAAVPPPSTTFVAAVPIGAPPTPLPRFPSPAVRETTTPRVPDPVLKPSVAPLPSPTTLAAIRPSVASTPAPRATPALVAANPSPLPTAAPVIEPPRPTPVPPPSSAPTELSVLSALAPPSVKAATTGLIDVHGRGLRPEHQARLLRGRDVAPGLHVVKQRYVDPTLLQVIVQAEGSAPVGTYSLILVDGEGRSTNSLLLRVTR